MGAKPGSVRAKGNDGLNARQRRFVAEYLVDTNASRAARAAGYSRKDTGAGSKLLERESVWAAIQREQDKIFERLAMSAAETVAIASQIARANLKDALNEDGTAKPLKDWPREVHIALSQLEMEPSEQRLVVGESGQPLLDEKTQQPRTVTVHRIAKIKLTDKTAAVGLLMRRHGLLKDKVEHDATKGFAQLVREAWNGSSAAAPEGKS